MGHSNFRSLLIAAIVISNCITWTASRHHYTHNVHGHRSRHRRQGAGLFLSSSYVIPGGEGTGAWGEWGEVSPCSRTCGGGVASQKRICLEVGPDGQPLCTGGDTKFFSCQTQDCPDGAQDFRAQQCSEYDDVAFKGIKYRWVPYTKGPKPCELNCMPRGERFYYRQKTQVVDGTRCSEESFDVCVNGTCQPVGCDMMLGSSAREDKCRECRGNGANCHTATDLLDTQDLRNGYNDMLFIPAGATNIYIAEVRPSSNYLALRATTNDTYYLNGYYHIDFPRSIDIAGATWHYERSQNGLPSPDKLKCLGPTDEPLFLSLLVQEPNVGIEYEYSIPKALAPPPNQEYNWVHDEFSPCSATCGGGVQTRNVTCRSREELEEVDEGLCNAAFKPDSNQTCNSNACPAQWVKGPWGECSKHCGEGGTRSRMVRCEKIGANGYPTVVANKECLELLGPMPALYEECNQNATCPIWFTGPWKPCDKLCDEGKQTRQVVCYQNTDGRVEVLDDKECSDDKPQAEQPCMLHPCDGVDWVVSDWTGCDNCLSKVRTRTALCATKDHRVFNDSFCSYHNAPKLEEKCDPTQLPPCEIQWYATQWSKCSAQCGKGVQTRRVFCGMFDGESVLKVAEDRCDQSEKYNSTRECEVEKCPALWFAAPWTECSAPCDGGEQHRRVMCMRGTEQAKDCDIATVLDSTQACNLGPCNADEVTVVGPNSTPIMDDYDEECEPEDEYPEVGAEEDDTISAFTEELMFSDSPTPDLPSSFSELESEFKETGSGETLFTEGSGFGTTDSTFSTDEWTSDETGSTEETSFSTTDETTESRATDSSSSVTESTIVKISSSTDDSSPKSSESTVSTVESSSTESTNVTGSTESTDSVSTSSDFDIDYTDLLSSKSDTTESSDLTSESGSEKSISPSGSTEPTETKSSSVSGVSDGSTVSGATELSGPTESTLSESTESESIESESTETTESEYTDETESTVTDETETTDSTLSSESSSTDETSDSSSVTTSSGSDTTDATTESGLTESTGTTESGTTEVSATVGSTEETGSSVTDTSDGITSTEVSGSTEPSVSSVASSTESGSTLSEATEITESGATEVSGSGETTEADITTEASSTKSSGSTESSSTESTESGATEVSSSSVFESTESSSSTTESGDTEEISEGSTDSSVSTETAASESEETESTEASTTEGSTESVSEDTGSTVSITEETEFTETGTTESGSTESIVPGGTTLWDWATTIGHHKRRCLPRASKCKKSTFGCCPDGRTPAAGPFDEGCGVKKTCAETEYKCCPDGVSPATGPKNKGCPIEPCEQTLFGCCKSDNKTAAEGNDDEGCPPPPPPCKSSKYGCCKDEKTEATGPGKAGCPETVTQKAEAKEGEVASTTILPEGTNCNTTEFGCCPDGVSPAAGSQMEGCVMSCNSSAYGCCPDGETPAHGYDYEGCCLLYPHGCCPDNFKPAEGPHLEGCGCKFAHFGCCPDNVTIASGPNNEGCGCQYSEHGCCPDKHTPASGPEYDGCDCHTYQFGCCDDGFTIAKGPGQQGCLCQQSEFGCCGDGKTAAAGPDQLGCDCSNSKYGCCPDGQTPASGTKFLGCTDKPENRQAACALSTDRGPCTNYTVYWYYDLQYGGCSRFWYGGCEGNGNRFTSKEECEDVCVQPPPKDACNLPKVKGACTGYLPRWYFDTEREQCGQFIFGGCLGNANNFDSRELCQKQCEPAKSDDQCSLPIDRGTCAGNFLRYGFNPETRQCEPFVWGGCGGNNNRFGSESACQHHCNPPGVPQLKDTCTLPALTGECADYTEKWYYDTAIKRCRQFYYGGCGGNENRFSTEAECEGRCVERATPPPAPPTPPQAQTAAADICTLPSMTGECDNYTENWFFDSSISRCRPFYYGGCGGNGNRFGSEAECSSRCAAPAPTTPRPAPSYGQDLCQLPMLSGPCNDSVMSWFYDPTSDSCSQFTYSGCGGNDNRFENLEDCERRCRTGPEPAPVANATVTANVTTPDVPPGCRVSPYANEECAGEEIVWYLDVDQHACVMYINAATGNTCRRSGVFQSEEACERSCGAFRNLEVCRYPVDPGPCRAAIPKFYYNEALGSCVNFTYGGCHGGPNRFSTVEDCENVCKFERDPCKRTPKQIQCVDYVVAWFYEESRDECFQYGSCDSSDRLATREECEGLCLRQPAGPTTTTTTAAPSLTAAPQPSEAECVTPSSLAPCGNNVTVFYYDSERKTCLESGFGGCGHPNSYRTEEECERRCGAFVDLGESNEVLPDCDRYNEECASLRCAGGVTRAREPGGCERCYCAQRDCAAQQRECAEAKCAYGVHRAVDTEGCERCTCVPHPCKDKECPAGQRCVSMSYQDPITQELAYTADCRVVNKGGVCPAQEEAAEGGCRRECNDDADCRGAARCCARGCSRLCLAPATPTSPRPVTTTFTPELPQAPQADPATEPEVAAAEGGRATLRCVFHGNPPPKITWRHREITIDGDAGRYRILSDGALEIVSLYRTDSGVYICVAENIHGRSQQEIRLQVNVPVNTSIPYDQSTLAVGSELSLPCDVDGYPLPEIYWTKDGVRLTPNSRTQITDARLTVSGLTTEDSGVYGCHALNAYSSHSSQIQITVQGVFIPAHCTDNPFFADCKLIVRSKFCTHQYYSRFCCASCVKAGQLNALEVGQQADEAWKRKK